MKPAQNRVCSCLLFTCIAAITAACSDGSSSGSRSTTDAPPPSATTYNADIVWTEYGIPHVTAQDWGGLGYGSGYAYAQLNYCWAMNFIVAYRGETARYSRGSVSQDLVTRALMSDEQLRRVYFDDVSDRVAAMRDGYAAGMNRYLAETGVDNLPEACRGADWVREVDGMDIAWAMRGLSRWRAPESISPLGDFILAAKPPETFAQANAGVSVKERVAGFDRAAFIASIAIPESGLLGSNSYAIGGDASQSGAGVLWDNPHLFWGAQDMFMIHQTMGEEFDLMGTMNPAMPFMIRGFNKDLAWSHTISYGTRFMLYELELNPDNPMQYLYEGELRDIESRVVTVERVNKNGEVVPVEHTFYYSHIGPILDVGGDLGGWPTPFGTVLTVYLPNQENNRRPEELLRMGQASNIEEFKQAIASVGIDSVHTLAADRHGDAFYGDIAVTPNISAEQLENCVRGPLASALTEGGFITFDGSDPDCALANDTDTAPGIRSFERLPQLDTREYAANANQGFWMINPRNTIEGFPEFMGGRVSVNSNDQLPVRPRQLFLQAEQRLNGTDDLGEPGFTVDNIREMVLGSRSIQAEHLADDLVELCLAVEDWSSYTENTDSAEEACEVLASWDQRFLTDSVGAHIFREFESQRLVTRPTFDELYATAFDPADPFNTPAGLIMTSEWVEANRRAFGKSVDLLVAAGAAMDSPWGEINFVERGGNRYPVAGGSGGHMLNVVESINGSPLPGKTYSRIYDVGWIGARSNSPFGNTYMSAVSWDETDCPDAYVMLTYSQSSDPDSPHHADSTALFSEGGWIDAPFCQTDIEAQEIRREAISE